MAADDERQERPLLHPQEWREPQAMEERQQVEEGLGTEEKQEQKQAPAEVQAIHQRRNQNGLRKAQKGVQS